MEVLSQDFRDAYINELHLDQENRQKILQKSSERGIEILRFIPLSIRSEQRFGAIPSIRITVGALKRSASTSEVSAPLIVQLNCFQTKMCNRFKWTEIQ